jgi:REP element-mobilizing transposase RayT
MARPLRIQHQGGWYHVVNRGINRGVIYADDRDREHFIKLLEAVRSRHGMEVHGFVLMENHYHLIVRLPEGNLSRGMQWLNVSYSIWYNRRHGRVGPLFQGRYKSVPVEGGGWLYQLSQYVHLNPVRVRWLGLDKRGRRLEGLGLKGAVSAAEAQERLAECAGSALEIIIKLGAAGGGCGMFSRWTPFSRAFFREACGPAGDQPGRADRCACFCWRPRRP